MAPRGEGEMGLGGDEQVRPQDSYTTNRVKTDLANAPT